MLVSIVIPAYRASGTIAATLRSVFAPIEQGANAAEFEVVVVDDGSPDGGALKQVCSGFPAAKLVVQAQNRGRLAAINAGAAHTHGDVVIILDADDTLVENWPSVLERILDKWPGSAPVCYSACRNQFGRSTVAEPGYEGPMTLDDLLNERHAGEYLVLVRGTVLRSVGYVPVSGLAACEVVSYLNFAEIGPCWITPEVMRIYQEGRSGSLSAGWGEPAKAAQMVHCYETLFERYGQRYAEMAPRALRSKRLRFAVYLMMADRGDTWRVWRGAAGWDLWRESLGSLLMCLAGRKMTIRLVAWFKRIGVVRRYG